MAQPTPADNGDDGSRVARHLPPWLGWAVISVFLGVVLLFMQVDRGTLVTSLVDHEETLRRFVDRQTLLALALYMVAFAAFVSVSIPCAFVMTVMGGFLFGAIAGAAAAVVASTIGAVGLFLIARTTIGAALAPRLGRVMARIGEGLRRGAWSYLLFLRFALVFPFWIVNLVPALLRVPIAPFAITTFFGIMPVTTVVAFAGASLAGMVGKERAELEACRLQAVEPCLARIDMMDIFSAPFLTACAFLALASLLPLAVRRWRPRGYA